MIPLISSSHTSDYINDRTVPFCESEYSCTDDIAATINNMNLSPKHMEMSTMYGAYT